MIGKRGRLDPREANVAIDANSLDRTDTIRAAAVDRLLSLAADAKIRLIVPKGVRHEMLDPRTPAVVRNTGLSQIFTYSVDLNSQERRERRIIEAELQGNATPGKHTEDADHLFEASKYCTYFITHDERILRKSEKLQKVLPTSLQVVTLIKFLEVYDCYETGLIF